MVIEIGMTERVLIRTGFSQSGRERGLIDADESLSEQKIFSDDFLPGFSTASQVTDISGRGVGMDVVRQNIESLRGKIEIFLPKVRVRLSVFFFLLPWPLSTALVTVNRNLLCNPSAFHCGIFQA